MTRQRHRPPATDADRAVADPVVAEPTAEVLAIKPYRQTRDLRVRCPYCGHEHAHALGWGVHDRVQYRLAHCGAGDYAVIVPAWAAELVRPGRAGRGGAR